jgi:hypothetical protein
MSSIPPWANGPFELLVHAEGHLRDGEDFDRRIALISFDNAIEVAITTYLTLHPIQRSGRDYARADVERWLTNYHSKLDFLEAEAGSRDVPLGVDRAHIVWVHDHRNEQYHGGNKGTPERAVLKIIREAALWIFGFLFDVDKPEEALEVALLDKLPPPPPHREKRLDVAIDGRFGVLQVGEETYYVSEILFSVDHFAYRDLGERLCSGSEDAEEQP